MGQNLEVKLLDIKTIDEQVKVYMNAFDIKDTLENTIDYWKKKHFENPIHSSYVFGVLDGDKLVSINAYMPIQYQIHDTICNVLQSCESGTIPEYRGKGIWSKVVRFAVEYFKSEQKYDFLIGFPNFENSYGGFMKMKWSHDTDVINYVLIGNGKRFIKSISKGKTIPLSSICCLQRIKIPFNKKKGMHITNEIANYQMKSEGFTLCESDIFLEWKRKYKGIKEFGIAGDNNTLIAICRYFMGEYNGESIAQICYIRVLRNINGLKSIYASSIEEILRRHSEVAFIRTWSIAGTEEDSTYRSLLFLKSKHHNPFITYQLKDDVISGSVLHDKKNWKNLTFLDLD